MKPKRPKLGTLKPNVATLSIGSALSPGRSEEARKVYDSARWKRVRRVKLAADPLCQACAYHGKPVAAEHVDHWTPIREGGDAWADENLVSLCRPCHGAKTRAEMNGEPYPQIVPSKPRNYVV